MSFASSKYYSPRLYGFLVLLLMTVSLTLLIVAVSLHNLATIDYSKVDASVLASFNLTVSPDSTEHFGAFYSCADIDGTYWQGSQAPQPWSVHQCYNIPSNCVVTFTVQTQDGPITSELDLDSNAQGYNCKEVKSTDTRQTHAAYHRFPLSLLPPVPARRHC